MPARELAIVMLVDLATMTGIETTWLEGANEFMARA
jgi:hypothetical protein